MGNKILFRQRQRVLILLLVSISDDLACVMLNIKMDTGCVISTYQLTSHQAAMLETKRVENFSEYSMITFYLNGMLYNLNYDFRFFAYQNITKTCIYRRFHFIFVTSS